MTIHYTLQKLYTLGDSEIVTPEVRAAVKEAANILHQVRTLCSLPASAEMQEIIPAVNSWVIGGMGHAFHRDYIAVTVGNLRARFEELTDAVIECQEQRHADPLETERRMIQAALAGVDKEYGSKYFDKVEG